MEGAGAKATAWRWSLPALVLLLVLELAWLVLHGQHNVDEAWYLEAGRSVLDGRLPYRDFFFPQTPLMAWFFAVPDALAPHHAFLAGRALMGFVTLACCLLSWWTARVVGGRAVGVLTLSLLVLSPWLLYKSILVRPAGLVALLLSVGAWALLSRPRDDRAAAAAVLATSLATLARASAAGFSLVVLIHVLRRGSPRGRRLALGAVLVCALLLGVSALLGPSQAWFGIFGYHQIAAPSGLGRRLYDTLVSRPATTVYFLPAYVVAAIVAAVGLRRHRDEDGEPEWVPAGRALWWACVAFAVVHVIGGEWYIEYLTPILPVIVVLFSLSAMRLWRQLREAPTQPRSDLRSAVLGASVVAVFVLCAASTVTLQVTANDRQPTRTAHQLADYLDAHTQPGDTVLALAGELALVDSDRAPTEDVETAYFSYLDLSDGDARTQHVVNLAGLTQLLESRQPAAVVVTEYDRDVVFRRGGFGSDREVPVADIMDLIEAGYAEGLTVPQFGQFPGPTTVWLRRG